MRHAALEGHAAAVLVKLLETHATGVDDTECQAGKWTQSGHGVPTDFAIILTDASLLWYCIKRQVAQNVGRCRLVTVAWS